MVVKPGVVYQFDFYYIPLFQQIKNKMIGQTIAKIAQIYLGKQENSFHNNSGFQDPVFQSEMVAAGWQKGDSWCAFLAIDVWSKAYAAFPDYLKWARKLFSGNSQEMGRNFHADPKWPTSTTTPMIGAMVIFGDVGSTTSGHTGAAVISISADGKYYTSVEGNTIPSGNPGNVANGYIVATHTHAVGAPHPISGLQFLRFVYPVEPGTLIPN